MRSIHLVEDDRGVREMVTLVLERRGYTVQAHESADLALASISEHQVVVADCVKTVDGVDILDALMALPCIVAAVQITARAEVTRHPMAISMLQKPFDISELVQVVDKACEEADRLASATRTLCRVVSCLDAA